MISRLNDLDIGSLKTDGSIILSVIGINGGITLGVNFEKLTGISGTVNLLVSGSVPGGLTLNSPIGISGSGLGLSTNLTVSSARNFIGFISGISGNQNYTITTAGKIQNSSLNDNTLYYLNTTGGITSNRPTANNSVIKPVLLNINSTLGGIVLQQNETLISETAVSYIKSSSRTIAEIPTNPTLSSGNVVFYNLTGTTWARSKSDAASTSEVFGIIESIAGSTATIVTHGSVNVPNSVLNTVGDGGAGGNDIWFLSAATAGQLQNQAPTQTGSIIKPVYYAYPHEISGATFSGYLVNYIGYAVGASVAAQGSVSESTSTSTGIAIGEMKQVAFHGNRLGMKNWLSFLKTLIDGCTFPVTLNEDQKDTWRTSVPYDIGITRESAFNTTIAGSTASLEDFIDKTCVELSGSLLLAEEQEIITIVDGEEVVTTVSSKLTIPENINKLLTTTNDASSLSGVTYYGERIPLDRFTDVGVKSILKIKTNSLWNVPNPEIDKNDRWSQLKRLWFSQTDNNGNRVKMINWANASLLRSDQGIESETTLDFGDFIGIKNKLGKGLDFDYVSTLLMPGTSEDRAFKRQILTSFYLPGFILDIGNDECRTGQCLSNQFPNKMRLFATPSEDGESCEPIREEMGAVKGYVPIYSNWMTSYSIDSNSIEASNVDKWQEIGFVLADFRGNMRYLFIYSPTMAIKNGIWNLDEINLNSFFSNISRIPGRFNNNNNNIIDWAWTVRQWQYQTGGPWYPYPQGTCTDDTWNGSGIRFVSSVPSGVFGSETGNIKLDQDGFLKSVLGIHLPDYSSPYSPSGSDDGAFSLACSIPKTVMRVI